MLSKDQISEYRKLGQRATELRASRLNAGNANEAAASANVHEVDAFFRTGLNAAVAIAKLQVRCGLDLSALLTSDDVEAALTAFCGGCFAWVEENPD